DRLPGEHQKLRVVGRAEDHGELAADDDGRAAMLHVGGAVEALDELKYRFRPEFVELRQRLLALFPFELAGVVEDEAVDDLLEAGVFLLAQERQTRGKGVGLLRRRLAGRQEKRQT